MLKLTLDWNAIMDEGVASLAAALRCDVKPPDMCLVFIVLFRRVLTLFRCFFSSSHHVLLLCSVNRTLQALDLTSTRLTAAGATSLAEALRCVLRCLIIVFCMALRLIVP